MKFGFCHLSVIDIFREETCDSCLVGQLLFGEIYIIEESKKHFSKIMTQNGTLGYVDASQVYLISKKEYATIEKQEKFYTTDILSTIEFENNIIYLNMGSVLYDYDGLSSKVLGYTLNFSAGAVPVLQHKEKKIMELLIRKTLNFPYKNGGNTLMGMDGLGLAIHFFKYSNITIERNLDSLATKGIPISLVKDCVFGDIIFFGEKKIEHIGIVLNSKQLIHSYGSVKISPYDYLGIKEESSGKYTHNRIQKIVRLL